MNVFEVIEQLCAVTRLQADIIEKQAEIIAQSEIADAIAEELLEMRRSAASSFDSINKNLS
ncbi:MAG: hypothetical protein IJP58_06390 [Clostridia bacterium]|nr:hypothetical protein [Clostridia bacterium]